MASQGQEKLLCKCVTKKTTWGGADGWQWSTQSKSQELEFPGIHQGKKVSWLFS